MTLSKRAFRMLAAAALASCSVTAQVTEVTEPQVTVSCEPVPRFRLGDVEYENRRFDDTVTEVDLGRIVGTIDRQPPEIDRCEPVVLADGEGSWSAGTKLYEIIGVDPSEQLAASLGGDVYLVFDGRPVAP